MYTLRILDPAITELSDLDKTIAKRIIKKLKWLAENFENIYPEVLKGELSGFYKLRVGNYRIIYEVFQKEKVIIIHLIGHRRDIYKQKIN